MTDQTPISSVAAREPKSHAWWNAVNAWLLLLPAAVLLVAFTHYPIIATIRHSFFIARRSGGELFVGFDNYRAMFEDAIFWKALTNNFWFALGTVPDLDGAGAADGALGQSQHARARVSAARLFHADRAADDRGGQYLAVLLHAGLWIARSVAWPDGVAGVELARRSLYRDGLPDCHGDLEGGRLLHDLLSRSTAAACRPISRKQRRSRAQAAGIPSGASRFRC